MRFWPKFLLSQLKKSRFRLQVPEYFLQEFFADMKGLNMEAGTLFLLKSGFSLSEDTGNGLHVLRILQEAVPDSPLSSSKTLLTTGKHGVLTRYLSD